MTMTKQDLEYMTTVALTARIEMLEEKIAELEKRLLDTDTLNLCIARLDAVTLATNVSDFRHFSFTVGTALLSLTETLKKEGWRFDAVDLKC